MPRNPVGWFEIYVQDVYTSCAFYQQGTAGNAESACGRWHRDVGVRHGTRCRWLLGALIAVPGVASGWQQHDCSSAVPTVPSRAGTAPWRQVAVWPRGKMSVAIWLRRDGE